MNHHEKFLVALFALGFSAGCQTDLIVGRGPVRGAPVTAFESVQIARQSGMSLAEKGEVDLVEQLIYHRTMYARTLRALDGFYRERGYQHKHVWTENELADVQRIRPYHYLLDSELPRLDLRPSAHIPQADALFAEALRLAQSAGLEVPALYNREKMSAALLKFKQLIREYPTSDKIDDAAFYCGELHKEYFEGEEPIAVKWYELAWSWDPTTPHPARFQAAVVYDFRLHQREKALELYRATLAAEPNRSNRHFAMERINQLTRFGTIEGERTLPVPEASTGLSTPVGRDKSRRLTPPPTRD